MREGFINRQRSVCVQLQPGLALLLEVYGIQPEVSIVPQLIGGIVAHDIRKGIVERALRLDGFVERIQRYFEITGCGFRREGRPQPIDDRLPLEPPPAMDEQQLEELPRLIPLPVAWPQLDAAAPDTKSAQRLHAQLIAGMNLDLRQTDFGQQASGVSGPAAAVAR